MKTDRRRVPLALPVRDGKLFGHDSEEFSVRQNHADDAGAALRSIRPT